MESRTKPPEESVSNGSDSGPGRSRAPRLFIKEMVMRNFKSYAGEQRVGPFHKSFSAVVGPNGSGKSNVIDAMLFVFGKRAKQMRLNKVSELIHNSTNHQNLDSAGVSVHFQEIVDLDDGTYEAVPGSDFVIARVAFRDNSSKYYINDRPSNFTEGEVEQISLMKPKAQGPHDEGFLEYLEDIIGTNKYVEKIDESHKQLETLNERRSGVVQMVKLAEKERNGLEDVKNEAEAYMLKELSLLKWQEKAAKLASGDTSAKMVELQANMSNLEENLKNEREKIRENNQTLKELETLHNKYMKRQEQLDDGLRTCKDEFKEFERQDLKYREDVKHMERKIKKLEDKIEKDSSKINQILKESEDSADLIPKLEDNIPKLQKQLVDEEKVLEEIEENSKVETEVYRSELARVRVELEPWEKQLIEHKGKLEVASTERKLLNEKHEAGRVAFEDAQKQMDDMLQRIETKSTSITNIESDLARNKLEALEARKVEQECNKEQEATVLLEQAARQKVTELMSLMESEKSQGSVLKAILQAKESNQIEGIYGRMGDLGAIDAKYDVAISTACPGLEYIVVETTGAAQACVELLRRKNLGVATFMILEKQVDHLHRMKDKVSTPEGVPRLFDLIKIQDERMKLAFFAALGNTVVAKDIDQVYSSHYIYCDYAALYGNNKDQFFLNGRIKLIPQATRIAYGGNKEFRRVDGDSIRPASVSAESVATAKNELSAMVDKLNSMRQKVVDAVRIYQASEKAVARLGMELTKIHKEALELQSKLKMQQYRDQSPQGSNRNRSKNDEEVEKGIEESKKEKDRVVDEKEKLHLSHKDIEQKAFTVQDNYNKTQELIDQHKDVLDKAKSDYEKLKKTVDELRASEVDVDYKLQDMKKLYKELEMKGKGYKRKLDELQVALVKHMEQIQKDLVDPEKLQATLADKTLTEDCGLKRALEMVALIEAQLKEMNPNLDSISEYRRKVSVYNERVQDLNMVTQERDDVKKQYDEWKKRRLVNFTLMDEFMAGFHTISLKLKEMYQEVMRNLNLLTLWILFSEGVVFSVRPPKKSWKNIANLSGGEKTLSSLALVFALHHYKPTPLYVMDEIDAALISRMFQLWTLCEDRTKDAQFIIISLRNNMFELADRLVGIYKTDNCTKSITINPESFVVCEKAA
ncbi:Structural maintenance of chromosomes protein 4 [Vitis vinifera]|uniref:Structural maintenance of chromosomes protein 4 n=1 Tax=Vitis vinifera TaxID=29760 RepID=A0A438FIB1_VITVI|nr:Structural maintenance of chromosomes protein 4 [Vitis vinifera]